VAAYLLSKNLEVTRASAEEVAKIYYGEQDSELAADELLNPSTIRDWATKRYNREKILPLYRPPDHMPVKLSQNFSKVKAQQWRVFPVEVDKTLHWFDPAGVLLAVGDRPTVWGDSFLNTYDFILDADEKTISSKTYMTFQ